MTTKKLDPKEAYAAMYQYLCDLYERTNSDDLGSFLGGMLLMDDGKPADSAVWSDWTDAIEKSQSKNASDIDFKLF